MTDDNLIYDTNQKINVEITAPKTDDGDSKHINKI